MDVLICKILILLTFALFFIPRKFIFYMGLILQTGIIAVTGMWALQVLFFNQGQLNLFFIPFLSKDLYLQIDTLTAFFVLIINFTSLTGLIFSKGYLQPYAGTKSKSEFSFHYFNFLWLHISMLLVTMFRDGIAFLVVWEIMSISSFFLVIFENDKKETLASGLKYIIQMHIGLIFILTAFLLVYMGTGGEIGFDNLPQYFMNHEVFPIFILFFIGFGIKAGFIPLHTWLPHAHPAAPSHVSGVMSGVMIKLGIYGILRVLTYVHYDLFNIGFFILVISLISGILGVSMAIVQHDIKKLLAYHSIENIGIIGIGIGLGLIGIASDIPVLAALGFAGSLLHVLNHSLFKSILFYSAGSVYHQTHIRNIEYLGGLIKKMPKTAIFFLIGSIAICGLPPFNGFISEFLIYIGIFKALHPGNLLIDITLLFSFSGLVIIGGLACFCFTKVFGIIFLGSPRSEKINNAGEVGFSMILPYYLIALVIIFIGLFPGLLITPLTNLVSTFTKDTGSLASIAVDLNDISIVLGTFLLVVFIIYFLRKIQQKSKKVTEGTTWSCGYTGSNPALHQYTATSYADNFSQLAKQMVNLKKDYVDYAEEEIFPKSRSFRTHSSDIFEDILILKPLRRIMIWLEKAAIFQTGKMQHYLLYALIFLIFIFILSVFGII